MLKEDECVAAEMKEQMIVYVQSYIHSRLINKTTSLLIHTLINSSKCIIIPYGIIIIMIIIMHQ